MTSRRREKQDGDGRQGWGQGGVLTFRSMLFCPLSCTGSASRFISWQEIAQKVLLLVLRWLQKGKWNRAELRMPSAFF